MSKGKEQGEVKKPVKRSWWARIGLFFSGLFRSEEDKNQEDIRRQINIRGSDDLALKDLSEGLKNPNIREDIVDRLASGRPNVTAKLFEFLSELENDFNSGYRPAKETDELLTYIIEIIKNVDGMKKGLSWHLGEADVPSSWAWWKQNMDQKVKRLETNILNRNPNFQRKLITSLGEREKLVKKTELVDLISNGFNDFESRERIQSALAKGPSYITLTIPAYLSDINKELKKTDLDPKRGDEIKDILRALKQFIEDVKVMPKETNWAEGDNTVTGSWAEWYTAVTNSIKHLEGKLGVPAMDNQATPKETVVHENVSSVGLPGVVDGLSRGFTATALEEEPNTKTPRRPLPNPNDLTPNAQKRPLTKPADFSQSDQKKSKEGQNPKPTEIVSEITHPQSESENLAGASVAKSVSGTSSYLTPPRVSKRGPLPPAPQTSTQEGEVRKSSRPQGHAPQPVRRKAVLKALRESQKGNLPDKQEPARLQENTPVAETPLHDAPPRPLPRKSESPGAAQPAGQPRASARPLPRTSGSPVEGQTVAKPRPLPRTSGSPVEGQTVAKPRPLPRTSQKSGQVGSLLNGRGKAGAENIPQAAPRPPGLPPLPPEDNSSGGTTPKK